MKLILSTDCYTVESECLVVSCLLQLDVLEFIHDNDYVHADIKGSNVLLDVEQGHTSDNVRAILHILSTSI